MNTLKWLAALIAFSIVLVIMIHVVQIVATLALPFLGDASFISLFVGIILIPISFIRKTAFIAFFGYWALAWIFGLTMWCLSFLLVFAAWGFKGVYIGCLIFGVGIIPLGFLSTAVHGQWKELFEIGIFLTLTFASHFASSKIASSRFMYS